MFKAVLAVSLGIAAILAARPDAYSAPAGPVAPERQLSELFGFTNEMLTQIDPQSLRPIPGKSLRVGPGGCAGRMGGTACWTTPPWALSPNEQQLAIARNPVSSLQLVDVARLRAAARIRIAGGAIGALAWLEPGRLLAVQERNGERQRLLAVDLARRRVVARRPLAGSVQRVARTAHELVLLLAPAGEIGPARVAIADARGVVRFVRLDSILAGSKLLGTGSEHSVESELPGLAVDPESRRAFVVDPRVVAEIDLNSLAVSYHEFRRPSLLSRLWNWLEPAAFAKQSSGHSRDARWLGGNVLAVSGHDLDESASDAVGLFFVDTRDWSVDTIDSGASSFRVTGDVLLAMGGGWDATAERQTGIGLAAYGFDGEQRFRVFGGQLVWMSQAYGGLAYVGISGEQTLRVVDLATGRVLGTRDQPLPWLLLGDGTGWWG